MPSRTKRDNVLSEHSLVTAPHTARCRAPAASGDKKVCLPAAGPDRLTRVGGPDLGAVVTRAYHRGSARVATDLLVRSTRLAGGVSIFVGPAALLAIA